MNQRDIVASLTQGFSALYTDDVDWGNPSKFDAEASDLDSWVHVAVPTVTMEKRRIGQPRRGTFRMVVLCSARTQDNIYACETLVGTLTGLLEHWKPEIRDYTVMGEPVVGYAELHEANMMGDEADKDTWQRRRIEVEGHFQAID